MGLVQGGGRGAFCTIRAQEQAWAPRRRPGGLKKERGGLSGSGLGSKFRRRPGRRPPPGGPPPIEQECSAKGPGCLRLGNARPSPRRGRNAADQEAKPAQPVRSFQPLCGWRRAGGTISSGPRAPAGSSWRTGCHRRPSSVRGPPAGLGGRGPDEIGIGPDPARGSSKTTSKPLSGWSDGRQFLGEPLIGAALLPPLNPPGGPRIFFFPRAGGSSGGPRASIRTGPCGAANDTLRHPGGRARHRFRGPPAATTVAGQLDGRRCNAASASAEAGPHAWRGKRCRNFDEARLLSDRVVDFFGSSPRSRKDAGRRVGPDLHQFRLRQAAADHPEISLAWFDAAPVASAPEPAEEGRRTSLDQGDEDESGRDFQDLPDDVLLEIRVADRQIALVPPGSRRATARRSPPSMECGLFSHARNVAWIADEPARGREPRGTYRQAGPCGWFGAAPV